MPVNGHARLLPGADGPDVAAAHMPEAAATPNQGLSEPRLASCCHSTASWFTRLSTPTRLSTSFLEARGAWNDGECVARMLTPTLTSIPKPLHSLLSGTTGWLAHGLWVLCWGGHALLFASRYGLQFLPNLFPSFHTGCLVGPLLNLPSVFLSWFLPT